MLGAMEYIIRRLGPTAVSLGCVGTAESDRHSSRHSSKIVLDMRYMAKPRVYMFSRGTDNIEGLTYLTINASWSR